MTRISTIHGIGADEYSDRGANIAIPDYVPYLSLTTGEMELYLAAQKAKALAQWYGNDAPQYAEAATMLQNALHAGVHGGYKFVGAVPDTLQNVARLIKKAEAQRRPASKAIFYRPNGAIKGIGQTIIPYADREAACLKLAKTPAQALECKKQYDIEKTVNDKMEPMAHHMLYKSLPSNYTLPTEVIVHRGYHRLGVEGIANVGKLTNYDLMYQWVETAILIKNAGKGVGPLGSLQSSFSLAPDPDQAWAEFLAKQGATPTGNNPKYDKMNPKINGAHVGIAPALIAALVTIISGAIGAAFSFLTEIRKTEILAMSEARGFGTPEFSAAQSQWLLGPGNQPGTAGMSNTMWLLLAAGAGLYFLTDND